jgi:hypothetical protein
MAYLRLAFASNRPRSLLLLGAKGSGRTTLAKIVGEKLEADRDILAMTIYEDVARVDAEGKLGDIKQCMLEWMERAKRRSPCLLILDGLDFLLGPENEVRVLYIKFQSLLTSTVDPVKPASRSGGPLLPTPVYPSSRCGCPTHSDVSDQSPSPSFRETCVWRDAEDRHSE